jgi:hypothetical protein
MKKTIRSNFRSGMRLALLIVSASLLTVTAIEGALWLFGLPPFPESVYNILERDDINGFKFKANGVSSRSSWEYDTPVLTNSIGIRDTEDIDANSSPEIFLIGDSFAEGHGVELENTIAKQLQNITQKKVANLGLASTGTIQQVNIFKHYLEIFKGKPTQAILVFYVGNDYYDNRRYHDSMAARGKPHMTVSNGYLIEDNGSTVVQDGKWMKYVDGSGKLISRKLHPGFVLPPDFENDYLNWSKLYAAYAWAWSKKMAGNCQINNAIPGLFGKSKYDFIASSEWRDTKEALTAFVSTAASWGIEPVIVVLPSKFQIDRALLQKAGCDTVNFDPDTSVRVLVDWTKDVNVRVINLAERFTIDSSDFGQLYYKVDVHLTAYGNRVAAEFIAKNLMKNGYNFEK